MNYEMAREHAMRAFKEEGEYPVLWRGAVYILNEGVPMIVNPIDSKELFGKSWNHKSPLLNFVQWCRHNMGIEIMNIGVYNQTRDSVTWAKTPAVAWHSGFDFKYKCRMQMEACADGSMNRKRLLYYTLEVVDGEQVYATKVDPETMDCFDNYMYENRVEGDSYNVESLIDLSDLETKMTDCEKRMTESQALLSKLKNHKEGLSEVLGIFSEMKQMLESCIQYATFLEKAGGHDELRIEITNLKSNIFNILDNVGYFSDTNETGYFVDTKEFKSRHFNPIKKKYQRLTIEYNKAIGGKRHG